MNGRDQPFYFKNRCIDQFGFVEGYRVWQRINDVFAQLPVAAMLPTETCNYLCLHGGIPRFLHSSPTINLLAAIASLPKGTRHTYCDDPSCECNFMTKAPPARYVANLPKVPPQVRKTAALYKSTPTYLPSEIPPSLSAPPLQRRVLGTTSRMPEKLSDNEMLLLLSDVVWSDPVDTETPNDSDIVVSIGDNSRGANVPLYGGRAMDMLKKNSNVDVLIRAHQCVTYGFEPRFGGRVYTLFSSSSYHTRNSSAIMIITPRKMHFVMRDAEEGEEDAINDDVCLSSSVRSSFCEDNDSSMKQIRRLNRIPTAREDGQDVNMDEFDEDDDWVRQLIEVRRSLAAQGGPYPNAFGYSGGEAAAGLSKQERGQGLKENGRVEGEGGIAQAGHDRGGKRVDNGEEPSATKGESNGKELAEGTESKVEGHAGEDHMLVTASSVESVEDDVVPIELPSGELLDTSEPFDPYSYGRHKGREMNMIDKKALIKRRSSLLLRDPEMKALAQRNCDVGAELQGQDRPVGGGGGIGTEYVYACCEICHSTLHTTDNCDHKKDFRPSSCSGETFLGAPKTKYGLDGVSGESAEKSEAGRGAENRGTNSGGSTTATRTTGNNNQHLHSEESKAEIARAVRNFNSFQNRHPSPPSNSHHHHRHHPYQHQQHHDQTSAEFQNKVLPVKPQRPGHSNGKGYTQEADPVPVPQGRKNGGRLSSSYGDTLRESDRNGQNEKSEHSTNSNTFLLSAEERKFAREMPTTEQRGGGAVGEENGYSDMAGQDEGSRKRKHLGTGSSISTQRESDLKRARQEV